MGETMSVFGIFNAVEASWWFLCSALTAGMGHRVRGLTPRLRAALSLLLLGFALSDLFEISTGAWWRPLGLLIVNVGCVVGISATGMMVLRNRQ